MLKKLCAATALAVSLSNPALADTYVLGVVDPVESQIAGYPEAPGQALLLDTFTFSIANGDWVKVDFQGMPSAGTGYSSVEFSFNTGSELWAGYQTPGFNTTFFSTHTLSGLSTGITYQVGVYGWGDPMSSATGSYEITLTAASSVTPVPEPEIYAMMGLGLGLLGWVGRRRKLQAA